MKSIHQIVREVILESEQGVRLRKIPVRLLYHTYCSRTGSKDEESDIINITPIFSGDNPKLAEIFDLNDDSVYDYLSGLGIYNSSNNKSVICAEGLLVFKNEDWSDCDGTDYSISLEFASVKDEDWNLIKNKIKQVLEQKDVDDAIRKVGDIKKSLNNQFKGKGIYHQQGHKIGQHKGQYKKGENNITKRELLDKYGIAIRDNNIAIDLNKDKYGIAFAGRYNNPVKFLVPTVFDYITVKEEKEGYKTKRVYELYDFKNLKNFTAKIDKGQLKVIGKKSLDKDFPELFWKIYRK